MSASPYHAPLMETVAQIYARSPTRLPPKFEACLCPVCMPADSLAEMIATPVRALTPDHLSQYRNSAHGVPTNPDDLRAILPRFLDLMAQDQWSDQTGVGVDLQRFGDGRITHAPLFDLQTEALLNQWAHLMILHTGWSEAHDQDTSYGLFSLAEVLLVGGWPPENILQALDAVFSSAHGAAVLHQFLAGIGKTLHAYDNFQTWALDRYRPEAIQAFVDWLNDLLSRPTVQAHLLSPAIIIQAWADPLYTIGGNITRATFHVPD